MRKSSSTALARALRGLETVTFANVTPTGGSLATEPRMVQPHAARRPPIACAPTTRADVPDVEVVTDRPAQADHHPPTRTRALTACGENDKGSLDKTSRS